MDLPKISLTSNPYIFRCRDRIIWNRHRIFYRNGFSSAFLWILCSHKAKPIKNVGLRHRGRNYAQSEANNDWKIICCDKNGFHFGIQRLKSV